MFTNKKAYLGGNNNIIKKKSDNEYHTEKFNIFDFSVSPVMDKSEPHIFDRETEQ